MIRNAKAVWRGTGRAGTGHLSTNSGVLAETPYSFKTRFENEKGTNPEELIAAAHAGCFTMALAFGLQAGGYTPTDVGGGTLNLRARVSALATPLSHCARKYPTWMKRHLLEWPATPRSTVRSRRCSTRRSRWMRS